MNAFLTLVRREYWEHRGGLLKAPMWLAGSFIVVILLAAIAGKSAMFRFDGSENMLKGGMKHLENVATPEQLRIGSDAMLYGTGAIFTGVMFIVVFFYCLGALYDDRRDRSVLFWRSMPVSDMHTVLSKVATALLLAPAMYFVALVLFQLVLMGVVGLIMLVQGGNPMKLLWLPAEPLSYWSRLFVALILQSFWILPLLGWLLLVSAWARSKPFLWAVLVPAALVLMEVWFHATASMKLGYSLGNLLVSRISTGFAPLSWQSKDGNETIMIGTAGDGTEFSTEWGLILERFWHTDMWIGVIVGVAFISAAIWIRRYRDDSATE